MLWAILALLFIVIFVLIPEWRWPAGLAVVVFVGLFTYVVISSAIEARRAADEAAREPLRWRDAAGAEVTISDVTATPPRFFSGFSSIEFTARIANGGTEPVTEVAVALSVADCPAIDAPDEACRTLGAREERFVVSLAPGIATGIARSVRFDTLPAVTGVARVTAVLERVRF